MPRGTVVGMEAHEQQGAMATRGGWRAARLLLVGAFPVAIFLLLMLLQVAGAKRDYLIERSHRDLRLASRQVAGRLDGLGAQCELGARDTWLGATTLEFTPCPPADQLGPPLLELGTTTFHAGVRPAPAGPPAPAGVPAGRVVVVCRDRGDPSKLRCGTRPLGELLPNRGAFDDVLLARGSGRVLAQADGARGTVPDLDELPAPSAERGAARGGLLAWLTFGSPPAEPPSRRARWTGLHYEVDVVLAGDGVKLFCAAVRPPSAGGGSDLAVCGLRRAAALSMEAWEVPPGLLAAGLVLLVATLCTWPALKLRLMGPTERLRARQVRGLVLSCLAGIGLAAFVVLDTLAARELRDRLDDEQRGLAATLGARLQEELVQAARQLAAFRAALEPVAATPAALDDGAVTAACARLGRPSYSRLSDLAVIDPSGMPIGACALEDESGMLVRSPAPVRPVADRRYFRDLREGRLWWLGREPGQEAAIEPVRTRSTGAPAIVLAQRLGPAGHDERAFVVVIAARVRAAIDPAVPAGLGFAVIERDGRVALHSSTARNLEENLFEECDGSPALRTAVAVGQPAVLRSRCYGRDVHRLVTQPLPGTPWTVVAFRNVEDAGLVNLAVADLWACTYLAYLLAVAVLLAVAGAARPRERLEWLWPGAVGPARYWTVAALLVAGTVLALGLATVLDGWARLAVAGVTPPLAIACVRRLLGAGGPPTRPSRCRRAYVAVLVSLTLTLAVVPAYAVFLAAWSLGTEAFAKRAQLQFVDALERRIRSGERPTAAFPAPWPLVYESSLLGGVRHRGGPPPAVADAAARGDDPAAVDVAPRHALASLLRVLPGPAETLSWFAALAPDAVGDERVRWRRGTDGSLALEVRDPRLLATLGEPGGLWLVSTVPSPGIATALRRSAVALLVVVGLLGLLAGLMHAVVVRLFLLGEADEPASAPRVWVHAVPAGQERAALLDEPGAGRAIDLARCPTPATLEATLRDATGLVVLDHVETRLADADGSDLLGVVESAAAREGARFALVSEVDPLAHLSRQFGASEPPPGTEPAAAVGRFRRWTRVLGGCTRLVLEPREARAHGGLVAAVVGAKDGRLPAPADATPDDFWRIWSQSSKAEKLAMAHLAHEGFLNPHAGPVLVMLLERGLVRRTPAFALFSPAFRRFVLDAEAPQDVRTWERENEKDWARAQLPLIGALAMAAAFLFLTQPHLFSTGAGMATAVAGALGGAAQLLRLVASRDGARSGTA